ncbi:hypothetical protein QJS66_18510 [Kocuria rhizophila]|nr:hypothetical protein QJS66_18510 [Kocuria rhizophila]
MRKGLDRHRNGRGRRPRCSRTWWCPWTSWAARARSSPGTCDAHGYRDSVIFGHAKERQRPLHAQRAVRRPPPS